MPTIKTTATTNKIEDKWQELYWLALNAVSLTGSTQRARSLFKRTVEKYHLDKNMPFSLIWGTAVIDHFKMSLGGGQ